MKTRTLTILSLLALALILTGVPSASAQTGGGYDLSWWTIDGGGGTVYDAGSGYTLMGTIGQPDADSLSVAGGYTLYGGFWAGGADGEFNIYLPLVLKNN